jgi:hypothetical protein
MIWLSLAWKFIKGLDWKVYAALAALALLWTSHHLGYNAGQADVQAKFDRHLAQDKAAFDKAKAEAAATEARQSADFAVIVANLKKEQSDALVKRDAVIAGLRNGTLQLRQHWQGCRSVPAAPADSFRIEEEARLRETDSGHLVQLGAEADSLIGKCVELLEAERR